MTFTRMTRRSLLGALAAALIAVVAVQTGSRLIAARVQDKSPESLEGQAAPDVSFASLVDGKEAAEVKLSSLKGSVVVLDYWATWCPPCRKSLPHLDELSQDKDLAAKGLKVFAVNSKEPAGKVAPFIAKAGYKFNVLLDTAGDFGTKYLVSGIPTTVVVGRDGKVAKAFVGFDEEESPKMLKQAVEEALKAGAGKSA